jgi:hypothetical protein
VLSPVRHPPTQRRGYFSPPPAPKCAHRSVRSSSARPRIHAPKVWLAPGSAHPPFPVSRPHGPGFRPASVPGTSLRTASLRTPAFGPQPSDPSLRTPAFGPQPSDPSLRRPPRRPPQTPAPPPAPSHPSLNQPRRTASIAHPARASALTAHARRTNPSSRHSRPLSPSVPASAATGRIAHVIPAFPGFPDRREFGVMRRRHVSPIAAKRSSAIPRPIGPGNVFCESRKRNGNSLREWAIRWQASAAESRWQTVISAQKNTFATARDSAGRRPSGAVRPARRQRPGRGPRPGMV